MTFELMSQNINSAEVELNSLYSEGVGDASGEYQAYLGGAVVQEYDTQIQSFTAELTAMNEEKAAVRADKIEITALAAEAQSITDADGYKMLNPDGTYSNFVGEAVVLSSAEASELAEEAASLGVTMDVSKLPTGSGTDVVVDKKFLDSMEQALDSKLTDLNSTSEMKSIQFQSLMDARKQAMMMLSNLISSDNQTKMAIIQNLKG